VCYKATGLPLPHSKLLACVRTARNRETLAALLHDFGQTRICYYDNRRRRMASRRRLVLTAPWQGSISSFVEIYELIHFFPSEHKADCCRREAMVELILVHSLLHKTKLIYYMVKIETTTRNLFFTMVRVHRGKLIWRRPWLHPYTHTTYLLV
jgi:hypothetical protein